MQTNVTAGQDQSPAYLNTRYSQQPRNFAPGDSRSFEPMPQISESDRNAQQSPLYATTHTQHMIASSSKEGHFPLRASDHLGGEYSILRTSLDSAAFRIVRKTSSLRNRPETLPPRSAFNNTQRAAEFVSVLNANAEKLKQFENSLLREDIPFSSNDKTNEAFLTIRHHLDCVKWVRENLSTNDQQHFRALDRFVLETEQSMTQIFKHCLTKIRDASHLIQDQLSEVLYNRYSSKANNIMASANQLRDLLVCFDYLDTPKLFQFDLIELKVDAFLIEAHTALERADLLVESLKNDNISLVTESSEISASAYETEDDISDRESAEECDCTPLPCNIL